MKLIKAAVISTVGLSLFSINSAHALGNIEFSGYMSLKGTYTDAKNAAGYTDPIKYANGFATDKLDWDTHGNYIGLQANAELSSELSATIEFQALGGHEKYAVDMQWAYVGYAINDDLNLRAGRVKGPFYMVSEYQEIGYAYPWIAPPQEVYVTNPMRHMVGLDMVYNTNVDGIDYLFEIYTSSGKHEATALPNFVDSSANTMGLKKGASIGFQTNNMVGFNATVGTGAVSFRAGYFDTKVDIPSFGKFNETGRFGGIGLIVDWRNIVIYSEYINRDTSPGLAAAFPDAIAGYFTLGYRFGDFLPHVTYSAMDKGKDKSAFARKQSSVTLGLRYDVGDTSAIKFEASQVTPDSDPGDIGKYGVFDSPIKGDSANTFAVSLDVIF